MQNRAVYTRLPSTRCRCGQIIGNKIDSYYQLLRTGVSRMEALDALKLERACCRIDVMTGPMYIYSRYHIGTINPKVISISGTTTKGYNVSNTKHTPIKNANKLLAPNNTKISIRSAHVAVDPEAKVGSKYQKELIRRAAGMDKEFHEISKLVKRKNPPETFGVEEPFDRTTELSNMLPGTIVPNGFVRDEKGNIILMHVGAQKYVPMLIHKIRV